MIRLALKMLMADRARYLGILVGLTFASLLITQQAGIFVGFMTRTYSFIDDTPQADLWVMDPEVEHHAEFKPMLDTMLYRVRSVEGVAWAAPMFKSFLNLRLPNGSVRGCILVGVDDATLMGAPAMVDGDLAELRETDAVLVNAPDAADKLAFTPPGGVRRPLRRGDILELNDRRARVVGTFRIRPSFFWEPVLYTTYSRALTYAPAQRKQLTYILVRAAASGSAPPDLASLAARIARETGMAVHTADSFRRLTARYIIDKTGIAINFGLAVALGFLVGAAIAGQTFYNFTLENLRHFAALKAMGTAPATLLKMVLAQSLTAGLIGYGLGVGAAAVFGALVGREGGLAFDLPWQLLVGSAVLIAVICILSALFSIRKVLRLEPGVVFKA